MTVSGRKSVNRPQSQYSLDKKARKLSENAGCKVERAVGVEPITSSLGSSRSAN